jgi:hypothetical protein
MREIKEAIQKLGHNGACFFWPESDYGKAYIYRCWGYYILMEIPMYGGEPSLSGVYPISDIDEMIKEVESWT